MFDVRDKIAIITGGARGFGKEFAIKFLDNGIKGVTLTDVNEEGLEETKKELSEKYGKNKIYCVAHDVTDKGKWESVWDETEAFFKDKVEILINNAGVRPSFGVHVNVDIMLVGVITGSFLALDRMGLKQGGKGGRIVNIASMAGIVIGLGDIYDVGYTIAKWGVVAFSRAFAKSRHNSEKHILMPGTQNGVKCYALCPWFADTKLVTEVTDSKELYRKTKHRMLTVEEVGNTLIKSLEWDVNGGVYGVFPDMPIMDIPNLNTYLLALMIAVGKVVNLTGLPVDKMNWIHFLSFIMTILFILYGFFSFIMHFIF